MREASEGLPGVDAKKIAGEARERYGEGTGIRD
jgi:hypothetical protein